MRLHQDRFPRPPAGFEKREGSIAKLEAAGIFVVFGVFSAVTLVLASIKRCVGKGDPPETGW